jgi:hypothetical protein
MPILQAVNATAYFFQPLFPLGNSLILLAFVGPMLLSTEETIQRWFGLLIAG